ncbi:MAG: PmoA family protein [Planctomycetaceae bacterium]|nr:PmoA family protein [Planctomycetaceae bacterium]
MQRSVLCLFFFSIISLNPANPATFSAAEPHLALTKTHFGYQITIDGNLFAGYRTNFNGTPIIWPLIGPNEKPMTRAYPMDESVVGEKKDHPHHRSLWFTQDLVNGNRHWMKDRIVHQEFLKAECDGKTATLVTKNHWLDPQNNAVICSDVRTIVFGVIGDGSVRSIDFDLKLTAEQEKVTIGDTKEGTFGIRVPTSIDVDAEKTNPKLGGTIVNAQGDKDDTAWGKRSDWVDYSGPIDGKVAGIAIFNHPKNFRYPTWWHVRTYGLFAANPFGIKDFEPSLKQDGTVVLKKGESLSFYYRVILHKGDAMSLDIDKLYQDYVKLSKE